jgi:outer membrane protein OmpA-like peptidoglycan-associated protein
MLSISTMRNWRVLSTTILLMLAVVGVLSSNSLAQDEATPNYDLFVGYQWLHPGGTVPAPFGNPSAPSAYKIPDMPEGFGAALTYNLDPHWGLEADLGHNWDNYETTASVGPRFMLRTETTNYFLHTMLSYNRLAINGLTPSNGIGAILGGGMDLKFSHRIYFRLFEADFVWALHNYANFASPEFSDLRRPSLQGVRLRTGLVFNFGFPEVSTPTAAVTVQPSEAMVGEPIAATATGSNFNPKHALTYNWTSTCGKITGKDTAASIDTNGAAGGTCTVTVNITDPKAKKNGEASASTSFTLKEVPKNPPTASCSASPTTVQTGGTSTVTCTCTSPDNVPVTVGSWTASSGNISGSGNSATLTTEGASPGTITVSATCSDQRGLSTPATTQVAVENPPPPPPPPPTASKLSSCDFPNPVKPWRVDNTCKAILDDVAKNLQQNADNKLVIVGNADPKEKRKNLAGERAVNSKAYLTGGEARQGIDPSRIEVRTGNGGTKTADFWVVPAGATFPGEGTELVDPKVKAVPDHPHVAAKRRAAKTQ